MKRPLFAVGGFLGLTIGIGIALALATGLFAASAGAQATAVPDAFYNITSPTKVKIVHTGGTVPNTSYSVIGRLALPAGSYAITAKADVYSIAGTATGVECYLMGGNALADFDNGSFSTAGKGANEHTLSFALATTLASAGNVDLRCRATTIGGDRKVFGRDVRIMAITVNSVSSTETGAPSLGA